MTLPPGTEILPPRFKHVRADWVQHWHGGFFGEDEVGGTGARPAIEVDGVVDGGAKAGRSMSRKGYEDAEPFCGDDDFWHGGRSLCRMEGRWN